MVQLATKWTDVFLRSAPNLQSATYDRDEIYMYCCWITLDYGMNYGYLSKKQNWIISLKRFAKP